MESDFFTHGLSYPVIQPHI